VAAVVVAAVVAIISFINAARRTRGNVQLRLSFPLYGKLGFARAYDVPWRNPAFHLCRMVYPGFISAISVSQFCKFAIVFDLEMNSGHKVVPDRNIRSDRTANGTYLARWNEQMLTRTLPAGYGEYKIGLIRSQGCQIFNGIGLGGKDCTRQFHLAFGGTHPIIAKK